jgi:UDP-N-acetylglucosamine 2-epimerase (non-hydrolysing)
MTMDVHLVAGARPNFMKIAPIYRASLERAGVVCSIVHTGQHYDQEMSQVFFDELGIPEPAFHLAAGSGSHATQTARIMTAYETACAKRRPDLVMVVGDVNSTLACSITAKKLGVDVAHVEAGLRSFDRTMPEEINRLVTDAVADHFFVTEASAVENLLREGKPRERVHHVGHVMVDNLLYQARKLEDGTVDGRSLLAFSVKPQGKYAFLTLHRPSNVDDEATFRGIVAALGQISEELPALFPVHPRTRKKAEQFGIRFPGTVTLLPPLGFMDALYLWKDAEVVLTDSGGLQEETTALGVPCVTIRENTERPVTVEVGTNVLAGTSREGILHAYVESLGKRSRAAVPPKWDGRAAERMWDVLTGTAARDAAPVAGRNI